MTHRPDHLIDATWEEGAPIPGHIVLTRNAYRGLVRRGTAAQTEAECGPSGRDPRWSALSSLFWICAASAAWTVAVVGALLWVLT